MEFKERGLAAGRQWFDCHLLRQRLSGVPAHFFREVFNVGKGQPSLRARSATTALLRFRAAAARYTEAPFAAKVRIRSSSSAVQGLDLGRNISVPEKHSPNREDGRADPNKYGGLALRDGGTLSHAAITWA